MIEDDDIRPTAPEVVLWLAAAVCLRVLWWMTWQQTGGG
jgi:hypothetical protein